MITAVDCTIMRFLEHRLIPEFFVYYSGSNAYAEQIKRLTTGTTRERISRANLGSLQVPVPSLAEQARIVAILDEAFEAIATAMANAEKNLANARELFDRQLRRLFDSLDDIEHLTLAQAATTFGRGKSKHRPRNDPALYGGDFPFVQTGDVRNAERYIEDFSQSYNQRGLAQSKLWPAGTVCITIAANIAETAILALDACFPDSIIGMIPDERRTTGQFVEYLLRYYKGILQSRGKGSAQDNINMATFETQPFPFPSLKRQASIVANLDSVADGARELTGLYTRKLTALAELKQSLLARAFSGELTASDALAA